MKAEVQEQYLEKMMAEVKQFMRTPSEAQWLILIYAAIAYWLAMTKMNDEHAAIIVGKGFPSYDTVSKVICGKPIAQLFKEMNESRSDLSR